MLPTPTVARASARRCCSPASSGDGQNCGRWSRSWTVIAAGPDARAPPWSRPARLRRQPSPCGPEDPGVADRVEVELVDRKRHVRSGRLPVEQDRWGLRRVGLAERHGCAERGCVPTNRSSTPNSRSACRTYSPNPSSPTFVITPSDARNGRLRRRRWSGFRRGTSRTSGPRRAALPTATDTGRHRPDPSSGRRRGRLSRRCQPLGRFAYRRRLDRGLVYLSFVTSASCRVDHGGCLRLSTFAASASAARPASTRPPLELVREVLELGAARHHLHQLVERELLLGEVAEHLPSPEDHEVVADRIGVVRVVRDEDDADASRFACTM